MVTTIFELIGIDPARFLKVSFEVCLITLFLLCFAHSTWVHGWKRTLREFSAGFILTLAVENIGVLCGAYIYPGFNVYLYATPLFNPLSWVAIVYIVMEFTNRIVYGPESLKTGEVDGFTSDIKKFSLFKRSFIKTIILLAVIDASLCVMIDVIEDPLATIYNWWIWVPYKEGVSTITAGMVNPYNFDNHVWMVTPDNFISRFFSGFFPHGLRYPTRPLGIPLTNFIDWFILVFSFAFSFRWVESKEAWSDWKKTKALWLLVLIIIIIMPFTILWNL